MITSGSIKSDDIQDIKLNDGEKHAKTCVDFINNSLYVPEGKFESTGFAVDYDDFCDIKEGETKKQTIIDNVKTALEDFLGCLEMDENGEIGFKQFDVLLPNSKKCLGGNGG